MFLHVCSNSKVKLGPLSRAAPKEKNSETRAPGFIDLLQEHRLLMGRRAGSGERGGWRTPVEAIAKDLGRGNDFRTVNWPSNGRQSVIKTDEGSIHQEYCGDREAAGGR